MAQFDSAVVGSNAKQDAESAKHAEAVSSRALSLRPDKQMIALICVYFTVFLDIFGVSNLIPVMPFMVGARPHPDAFSDDAMWGLEPGAAMSTVILAYNGAQLVSVLIFGPLSDHVGRKPMLLASLVGGAIGYSFQGVAFRSGSFSGFLVSRIFTGLFSGSRAVAVAYIADSAPPEKRAKLIGMLALSATLAMQFGPVLGGSIGTINLQLPFFVSGAVSAIGMVLVFSFVNEVRPIATKQQPGGIDGGQQSDDRIVVFFTCIFSLSAGMWMMTNILGNSLLTPLKFGFDPNMVGLASLGDGVMILVGNPIYLALIKRMRLPLVAAMGCTLMVLTAVCPFCENLSAYLVLRYVACIGAPLAMPTGMAIVSLVAPPHRRGAWTGLVVASRNVGQVLAPILLGVTFDLDYHVPFVISAGTIFVGFLALMVVAPRVPIARRNQGLAKSDNKDGELSGADPQVHAVADIESDILSQHAEVLVMRLRNEQERIRLLLDTVKEGKETFGSDEATPDRRLNAKVELNDWFIELLEQNGYKNWPEHLDGMKLMLFNSFPPLRKESQQERFEDLITVLEGHIAMAENSSLFDGADDLIHAFL